MLSAVALMMCVTMLIGRTYAWFTDSVTSSGNVIKSGTLDIDLVDAADNSLSGEIIEFVAADGRVQDEILWEPGCTYNTEPVYLVNKGSLALKYEIAINGISGDVKLLEAIDWKVTVNGNETALADLKGYLLPGDKTEAITLSGHMKEAAGNEYQDLTVDGISIAVYATQFTYEEDSFDNQYDKDATYPHASQYKVIPENATEPIILNTGSLNVELPADLQNELPDNIKKLQVVHTEAITDNENNTVTFGSVELVDQDGNEVDLEALGNTTPYVVTIPTQNVFVAGERVSIYHDGEYISQAIVNADNTITYEAVHFCEVIVSDTRIAKISSADELIAILTEIKTEAKKQIPGATGNKNYRENVKLILEDDIVVDDSSKFMYTDSNGAPFHFYGVKGVLDLNGHNITVTSDAVKEGKSYANAALLVQYSNIDIIGEGKIITNNQSIPVYGWANGTVNIYGGTYITNAYERNESAIYVNNPSMVINVYGGNFDNSEYAFNAHDNCANSTVMVLHEGVSYKKFLKNGTTDVITGDINAGRLKLADGCSLEETVIDGETWYCVVK